MNSVLPQTSELQNLAGTTQRGGRLSLWPLIAATFFMVSGGTYGTEEIIQGAGYGRGILILILTPLLWSLPVALMIGELSSALPLEGGYYEWVRRAMGNFWGFQEAWLSLAASIFDMAIYPTLFVAYLARLAPSFGDGRRAVMVGLFVVIVSAALNIAGIRVVGFTSFWLFLLLSAPFALIVLLAPFHADALANAPASSTSSVGLVGGTLIAMWNYMGWDNASTIAGEVERPQRTYPLAMFAAVGIVSLSYILPVLAMRITGMSAAAFETGSWADFGGLLAGPWLRALIVLGGMMSAFGMFNALVLSYSRLPLAMAQDGLLPKIFAKVHPKTEVPWVSVLACSIGWAVCLGLRFERLVTIDIILYGGALLLEFIALVVLRVREPHLARPYRVPGGMIGAVSLGLFPALLLVLSVVYSQREEVWGMNALLLAALAALAGIAVYGATHRTRATHHVSLSSESEPRP